MKALLCFYHNNDLKENEEFPEIEEMVNFLVLPRQQDIIHYKEVYYRVTEVIQDLDEGQIRIEVELMEE